MLICQSCNEKLPENGSHCPNCGAQTKCKTCQKALTLGARFCAECGAPVESVAGGAKIARADEDSSNFNVILYEDKNTKFSAKVSDNAFNSGSDVLGAFLLGRMSQSSRRNRQQGGNDDIIDVPVDGDSAEDVPPELPIVVPPKAIAPPTSDTPQLMEIFRLQGNELRIKNSRLKQRTRADFVTRATVLLLYAHEQAGRELVSRREVNALLSEAKVYDGTSRSWIANSDLLIRDGDNLGLSVPGREQAIEFLKQFADPNIGTPWTVGTKGTRRAKSTEKEEGAEPTESNDAKSGKGRKATGTSYRAQTRKLIESGFFKNYKTGVEAKAELDRLGFKFPVGRINGALVIFLQAGDLTREKNAADEWAYKVK